MGDITKKQIRDIAVRIDSGMTQRQKKSPSSESDLGYRLIKASDIEDWKIAPLENLEKVQKTPKGKIRDIQAGDVLIATKGSALRAVKVTEKYEGCIFSDTLTRIRTAEEIVIPDYLVLLLTLPFIKNKLERQASGFIAFIPRKELESILIPVPDIETQTKLVEIYLLFEKEKELTMQLLDLKQQLVNEIITKNIKGGYK